MPIKPDIHKKLIQLFEEWATEKVNLIDPIHGSGSERNYFRIKSDHKVAIGVYHKDKNENQAFVSFSKTFQKLKFNTPKIYSEQANNNIYLIEDLGNQDLFSLVIKEGKLLSNETISLYKKSLEALFKFQTEATKHIDFKMCTPRAKLDKQSLLWDLNYFKYYFLKTQKINFDEQKLENDFQSFINYLLEANQNYFIHRDFQSRNILVRDQEPYFIDYQGGRMGPLQYDVASLLFQVKANLSSKTKDELLNFYLSILAKYPNINIPSFKKYFYPYVLMRLCQVLGAYGFRGLIEKKAHFLQSIPFAISSLKQLLSHLKFDIEIPEFIQVLEKVSQLTFQKPFKFKNGLTIHLNSFAYKAGIPSDYSGHGEGFVFDCRFLPNPGILKKYQDLTGLDKEVKDYLQLHKEISDFIERVIQILQPAILKFQERKFSDLTINFGCTGGQHRSVYITESINAYLKSNYEVNIELNHTQKNNWPNTI